MAAFRKFFHSDRLFVPSSLQSAPRKFRPRRRILELLQNTVSLGACLSFALFSSTVLAQETSDSPLHAGAKQVQEGKLDIREYSRSAIALLIRRPEMASDFRDILKDDPALTRGFGQETIAKAQQILSEGSSPDLVTIKRIVQAVLPAGDPTGETLAYLASLSDRIEHFVAIGNLTSLAAMRTDIHNSVGLKVLESRLTRRAHALAEENELSGNPEAALELLGLILPTYRTDETISLGARAIGLLNQREAPQIVPDPWVFDLPVVQEVIAQVLQSDPGAKLSLAQIYSRFVPKFAHVGDSVRAEKYFAEVLRLRPDPNEENNVLRSSIVETDGAGKAGEFTEARVAELKEAGRLPFKLKVHLLFEGYFGVFLPIILIASLFGVLVSGAAFLLRNVRLPRISFKRERTAPGYMKASGATDEYSRLLSMFGLDDRATEEEIKKAFRKKMKELHPDVGDISPGATEEFQRLKLAYERITQIRSSWFGGR